MKHYGIYENITRFFSPVKDQKYYYFLYSIQSIIRGLNIVLHVFFLQKIVFFLENSDKENFEIITMTYLGVVIVYELLWFVTKKWGWVNTIPLGRTDIYRKYIGRYIHMDSNVIESIGTGKLLGIIKTGTAKWVETLAMTFEKGTELVIAIFFSLYLLSAYGGRYILIFIVLLTTLFILPFYANRWLFARRKIRYELRNTADHMLTKVIMSKNEVLQSGKVYSEIDDIGSINKQLSHINREMSVGQIVLRRSIPFTLNILLVGIFILFGQRVFEGSLSISELVGISSGLIIIQGIIINFLSFYVDMTKDFVEVQKLWDFYDSTPQMQGYETGLEFQYKTGNIQINNLSFGYNEKNKVFNNFNLDIQGGKITALVGNSGSGKSTLVKLIAGYIHTEEGDVIIDEQKISDISLKSYYKEIGYLTQEPSVFDGTIYDNLTYALNSLTPNPSPLEERGSSEAENCSSPLPQGRGDSEVRDREAFDKKLHEIIKLAKCEFIYDFPNGLETEIGEKGIRLSGGQRQRLAIAKIFLKDPKIIILDEPTSALDSFSEEQITKAMHNLFKNRTVIVIAHRLQTVKHADKIYVLENGEIQEEGTHASLVSKKGIYKKMLDLQSGF